MKCPKCGFNSFEYYDSCKKCLCDLIGFKKTYSITSVVLPLEAKEKLVAAQRTSEFDTDQSSDTVEGHDDIFSFDLAGDTIELPGLNADFSSSNNVLSHDVGTLSGLAPEGDFFNDLLESTPHAGSPLFTDSQVSVTKNAAAVDKTLSAPNEFDLESFSWDETTTTTAVSDGTDSQDDFDSLFGETKELQSK